MTSTPRKELSGSRFLQELRRGKNDPANAVCQYDEGIKIWDAKSGVEISITELFAVSDYFLVCQKVFGCTPGAQKSP
ncbi:hypothetical protein PFH44_10975 [Raoultella sp. Ech2A]|uniref:hypothetical protein n=1 Tax=Raoultella sp. Ech2A TaxID=2996539 RepID=UPI0024C08A20|nr:hypothetical protein [Raoultella sp. Ech2A]MDJ1654017.1 hypothetical protein [Raoultella sp. Ech2A]